MQGIVAGVLKHPITPLRTAEQSALGAALLAATGTGFYPDRATASRAVVAYAPPIEPRAPDIAHYDAAYALYHALYPRLRDTMHALRQ